MKFAVLLLLVFVGLVAAWTKEDFEIFRLRDELALLEGANVTFYNFLGVRSNANQDQIVKAHRQKSRTLHPDKVERAFVANFAKDKSNSKSNQPGVHVSSGPSRKQINAAIKEATDRYALLTSIVNVLKSSGRERYNHFLKNGFPKWKGTGYYYSRFRPGLGTVLLGLFVVFGGGAHYGALILSWRRQREFVDRYIRQARRAAWGNERGPRGIPGIDTPPVPAPAPEADDAGAMAMNRRQKRMMDKENRKPKKGGRAAGRASGTSTPVGTSTPEPMSTGERKRVQAENGKVMIVDSVGNVFLEEDDDNGVRQEFLLDVDQIHRPTIRDTALCRFPIWCFNTTAGRILGTSEEEFLDELDEAEETEELAEEIAETTETSKRSSTRRRQKRSQRS
ncbi:hypothetical protein N7495_006078 [Penicillium taxi]|uniref:uncharacterized protein n=1 Tax=Penicillium taxi TaxID=168475 RepID=UPI0025457732|nr:uncharacterized protein N7495_006078 [Penicillium taxi]KAJ5894387.1 hypothetical protein N7495_006078 [Penicillium taxi]